MKYLEYIRYKDVYPPLRYPVKTPDLIREGNVIKIEQVFVIASKPVFYEQDLEQAKKIWHMKL